MYLYINVILRKIFFHKASKKNDFFLIFADKIYFNLPEFSSFYLLLVCISILYKIITENQNENYFTELHKKYNWFNRRWLRKLLVEYIKADY